MLEYLVIDHNQKICYRRHINHWAVRYAKTDRPQTNFSAASKRQVGTTHSNAIKYDPWKRQVNSRTPLVPVHDTTITSASEGESVTRGFGDMEQQVDVAVVVLPQFNGTWSSWRRRSWGERRRGNYGEGERLFV